MSYQPLYATLSDDHGEVHTHCLRGRQEAIDGWVNTDIGELLRFHVRYDGEKLSKKHRKPTVVDGRITFPPDCIVTCENNVVQVVKYEDIPQAVINRMKGVSN
ncbi:hypothetical protein KKE60_07835 [Patescibacteria group bacterium]|nr:hypothetical protein [Patescibacteria group bacterium]